MTKTLLLFTLLSTFLMAEVVVDKNIEQFKLNDQFDKPHPINFKTTKVIFAFSKDIGHNVNGFLGKEDPEYLATHKTQFVIDLSGAPSLIRSLFIIPKLEKYTYPVLIIKDGEISKKYIDEKNKDKIMVVSLDELKVTSVDFFEDVKKLKSFIEK